MITKTKIFLLIIDSSNILDNIKIHCSSLLELMERSRNAKYKLYFKKYNETFCMSSLSFHWFNSTEKVALNQVEIINKVKLIP